MKQKTSLYLAGIVLLALALRLPRFLTAQVVLTEGTTYATIARNLAAGRGYVGILGVQDFFVPPLYPLLISGLIRLGMDPLWAGRSLSLVLGMLLPLPVYWLTRELSGRRAAGFFAALFIAGHPLLIVYASRVWSETTYSFLVWCGLGCGWAVLTRGAWKTAALAGLCFGMAYLTRHEGAIYFAIFFVLLMVRGLMGVRGLKGLRKGNKGNSGDREVAGGQGSIRTIAQIGRAAIAALVAFALLAVPYVVWLSGQAGRFVWETKSVPNFVTAQRMAAGLDYVEAAYGLTPEGELAGPFLFRNDLLRNPPGDGSGGGGSQTRLVRGRAAMSGLRQEAELMLTEIASPLALLLALCGLLSGVLPTPLAEKGRSDRQAVPLAGASFLLAFLLPAVAVISLVPRVYTRYLTPLTGYVALWCGMGLAAGGRWARQKQAASGKRRAAGGEGQVAKGESLQARCCRVSQMKGMVASLLSLLVLAVVLHSIGGGLLTFRPPQVVVDLDQRRAGEWLAAYDPAPDKRIMSVHSQLPFYAGGVHVPMPDAAPALVQAYAEAQGVDYVEVSPRKLPSRPSLEPWIQGEAIPAEWQPVYRDRETGLIIYQR